MSVEEFHKFSESHVYPPSGGIANTRFLCGLSKQRVWKIIILHTGKKETPRLPSLSRVT